MNRIQIFGPIEAETVSHVAEELDSCHGPIEVEICSDGGVVTGGIAIASMLRKYAGEVTTRAIGGVSSIASLIFLSGSKRKIESDCILHWHGPHVGGGGNREELEDSLADIERAEKIMAKRYAEVTNLSESEITSRFNRENFLDAAEAVAQGFATSIAKASPVMASHSGTARATLTRMASAEMSKNPRLKPHEAKHRILKANAGLRHRLNAEGNREAPQPTRRRRGKSATARKNRAVSAMMSDNPGMRRSQASRAVYKSNPKLRAAVVAESNDQPVADIDETIAMDDPIERLRAAVDELVAEGMTQEDALRSLMETDPELVAEAQAV